MKWSGPAVSGGASRLVGGHFALVEVAGDGISTTVGFDNFVHSVLHSTNAYGQDSDLLSFQMWHSGSDYGQDQEVITITGNFDVFL